VRYLTAIAGYILFDDSSDSEVAKVVRFVRKNLGEFFKPVPISLYREGSAARRLKYAVAEALYKTQLTIFRKIENGDRAGRRKLQSF